jgi:hypothetical protein
VPAALLDRLADDDFARRTTVAALADRDRPEVPAALLDRLTDNAPASGPHSHVHFSRSNRPGRSSLL